MMPPPLLYLLGGCLHPASPSPVQVGHPSPSSSFALRPQLPLPPPAPVAWQSRSATSKGREPPLGSCPDGRLLFTLLNRPWCSS